MPAINIDRFLGSFDTEPDPKKQGILDEAIRTFAELGYHGTDVQIIADRGGIGKGTVYRNYPTKEVLFWATVAEVDARLRSFVHLKLEIPPETVEEFLRIVAITYAEFFESNPDYLELKVAARSEFRGSIPEAQRILYQEEIALVCTWLEEGITRGELKAIDSQGVSFAFSALMDGVATIFCYSDAIGWRRSMVEQMELAVDLFLNGIRVPSDAKQK